MTANLSPFEHRVIHAAQHGEIATSSGEPVQANLIRDLLLGRHGPLDPRGVRITGARIVGILDLNWVKAVTGLSLTNCVFPDPITAEHAHLRYLDLNGSQLARLHADSLRTDGELSLRNAKVRSSDEEGAILLRSAHIDDFADLGDAEITNDNGPALLADTLYTGGNLILAYSKVRGSGEDGAIRLRGARISNQFRFNHATIINETGPALEADSLRTGSSMVLDNATVTGSGDGGAIRMLGAHIESQADFEHATITNETGPALRADGLHTDGILILHKTVVLGSSEDGAIRLPGAHIESQADFSEATITNSSGAALEAAGLRVERDLMLHKMTVDGNGENGALNLSGARVNEQLGFPRTLVSNRTGPLVSLSEARVGDSVFLPPIVICGKPNRAERGPCPSKDRQIELDMFTFANLGQGEWWQWLHLIRHHTPTYTPQPYQQLAAIERAAGHDSNARTVLIAQQDDLRRRAPQAIGGRIARARHWAWGWLGQYGYRASRLLAALATTLVLAGALGWVAGQVDTRPGHHAAERPAGTACSTVELIGLGIDRGLPLGVTGLRARCDLDTGTRRGEAFTVAIWIIQAAVWALATLAVASYTGLIRKPA